MLRFAPISFFALAVFGAVHCVPTAAAATPDSAKPDCFYCTKDARLTQLMIEVCELPHSTVYLFRNQFFAGRCVVAFKGHKRELYELTPAERAGFMDDVARVAAAQNQLFHPDKINYAIFGDEVSHVHFHVVPKYRNNSEWGRPFPVNPDAKKTLSDAEYAALVTRLQQQLLARAPTAP
jgi:ATP adenylyltransferase